MDLQSALVCVLVFLVSGTILFLISMFGMREKSYEEALAEQRQLTSGLLVSGKLKSKDKKPKKTGKKVKEKPSSSGNGVETKESVDEKDFTEVKDLEIPIAVAIPAPVPQSLHSHGKLHVEFEEPAVIEAPLNKDKKKSKKVKPILINKEKSPVTDTAVTKSVPINHFEKIHPKDEYEMLHAEIKEETQMKQEKQPEIESKASKPSKLKIVEKENEQKTTKQTKEKKQSAAVVVEETVQEPLAVVKTTQQQQQQPPVVNNHNNGNTVKDKKKKKSEFNTLQQMTASDKPGVNVSLLVPLVRKADLSRSEIQILIDLLLNKQHDGPTIIDEWSEGRSDPVQKLKKQLAEKDRLLTEEQEALVSAQAKLREVRAELNSERSRLLQNYRNLEETVHAKHTELQAAMARCHTQNQKLQQIQGQLNEEAMVSHKLRQELNQMQMQRQQMDMHLNQQKQEVESTFQTQLTQLRNELQEQQNLNAQLNMEIRNSRETGHAEKELLSERVRQVEREATKYKNELNQREGIQRQLEEFSKMMQNKVITLESEKAQLEAANGAQSDDRNREIEVLNLQNELASLRVHLQQRENQFTQEVEDLKTKIRTSESEIQTQKNKNDELRKKNWKMVEALNVAEATITKQKRTDANQVLNNDCSNANVNKVKTDEQEKCRKFVQRLFPDVKLSSNDHWMTEAEDVIKTFISELREREVKVKDACSAAESAEAAKLKAQYRSAIEEADTTLHKLHSYIEKEEIKWRNELQSKDLEIEALKDQFKNQSLKPECENGNNSPSDEHGVKFAFGCIERSLPLITEELQSKIGELEEHLSIEQEAKRELELECEALKDRISNVPVTLAKHTQFGAPPNTNLAGVEQFVEGFFSSSDCQQCSIHLHLLLMKNCALLAIRRRGEKNHYKEQNRLAAELLNEQKRCQELSEELLRLKSNVPTKVVQNHTNGTSSMESADLPSNSASSSSVSPTSTKPRSKKNKKKATVNN